MQKGTLVRTFPSKDDSNVSATVIKSFLVFQITLRVLAKGEFLFDPNNTTALINHLFHHKYFINTENNTCI